MGTDQRPRPPQQPGPPKEIRQQLTVPPQIRTPEQLQARPIPSEPLALELEVGALSGVARELRTDLLSLEAKRSAALKLTITDATRAAMASFGRMNTETIHTFVPEIDRKFREARDDVPTLDPIETPETLALLREIDGLRRTQSDLMDRLTVVNQRIPLTNMIRASVFGRIHDSADDLINSLTALRPENHDLVRVTFAEFVERRDAPIDEQALNIRQALNTHKHTGIFGLVSHSPTGLADRLESPTLEVPAGETPESLLNAIALAQEPSEEAQAIIDSYQDELGAVNKHWEETNYRVASFQAELNTASLDELRKLLNERRSALLLSSNFAMGLMLPWQWFNEQVWKTLGGNVAYRVGASLQGMKQAGIPLTNNFVTRFFGVDSKTHATFLEQFDRARADDQNNWQALGVAFSEQESNVWGKLILELFGDPTSLFGWGLYPKIFKFAPRISHAISNTERGFNASFDWPFKLVAAGLASEKLKTPVQLAYKRATDAFMNGIKPGLESASRLGVPAAQQSPSVIRNTARQSLREYRNNPQNVSQFTDIARTLTERAMITRAAARDIITKLSGRIDDEFFDATAVAIDEILNTVKTVPGGTKLVIDEAADRLLFTVNSPFTSPTGGMFKIARQIINNHERTILAQYNRLLKFDDFRGFVDNVLTHSSGVRLADQANPLSQYKNFQSMVWATMLRKAPVLNSASAAFNLATRAQHRFSRMYLMSGNYSAANVVETWVKMSIAGLNPFTRGDGVFLANLWSVGMPMPKHLLGAGELDVLVGKIDSLRIIQGAGKSPNAVRRIWRSHKEIMTNGQPIWRKFGSVLYNDTIGWGNRATFNLQAKAYHSFVRRQYQTNPLTAPIARAVAAIIEEERSLIKGADKKAVEAVVEEANRRALSNAASIEQMTADLTPDIFHAQRVQDILGQFNELDSDVKDYIVGLAQEGVLWKGLMDGSTNAQVTEGIWQRIFAEPEVMQKYMRELGETIMSEIPTTEDGFRFHLRMMQEFQELFTHQLHKQVRSTQVYAMDIPSREAKNVVWNEHWNRTMAPFLDVGDETIKNLVNHFTRVMEGLDVSNARKLEYSNLLTAHLAHMQHVKLTREMVETTTRELLNDLDVIITHLPGGKYDPSSREVRNFWDRFNGERNAIWDEADSDLAVTSADISEAAFNLDADNLPEPFNVIGRELTFTDVARLYGSNPQDAAAGVYVEELASFRSRKNYIERVWRRANRVAKQKNLGADDIGFNRRVIGDLYDKHLSKARVDLGRAGAGDGMFKEWEHAQGLLKEYSTSRSMVISPEFQESVPEFTAAVVRRIREDGVAREVLERPDQLDPNIFNPPSVTRPTINEAIEAGGGEPTSPHIDNLQRAFNNSEIQEGRIRLVRDDAQLELNQGFEFVSRETRAGIRDFIKMGEILEGSPTIQRVIRSLSDAAEAEARNTAKLADELADATNLARADVIERGLRVIQERQPTTPFQSLANFLRTQESASPITFERINELSLPLPKEMRERAFTDAIGDAEAIRQNLINQVPREGDVSTEMLFAIRQQDAKIDQIQKFILDTKDLPDTPLPVNAGYQAKRQRIHQAATDEYYSHFARYDNETAINQVAKLIFPFWSYEAHRWFYLPRIAMQKPAIYHAWGSYNENTDRGYFRIPGTDISINPIRSGIFMGGMHRLVNRDYPVFYDQFPGLANWMDEAGELGFYPGIYVNAVMSSPVANKAGVWRLGEVWPSPIRTGLELLQSISPENATVRRLRNIFLSDGFRDYYISTVLANNGVEGGAEILGKKVAGIKFTAEEQSVWDSAQREVGSMVALFENVGLLAFRPRDLEEARKLCTQIMLDYLPITEELLDEANRLGYPLEELVGGFPPALKAALDEVDLIRRFRGRTAPLRESAYGQQIALLGVYFQLVEDRQIEFQQAQVTLDDELRTGLVSKDDWVRESSQIVEDKINFIENLKKSPTFWTSEDDHLPIEFQERLEWAQKHNKPLPVLHPAEEATLFYFSQKPDDFERFNDDTGQFEIDWVGFYAWQASVINVVPEEERAAWLGNIHKNETDLKRIHRLDYQNYINPYKGIVGAVLNGLDDETQAIMQEYYATDSRTRREELQAMTDAQGNPIVGQVTGEITKLKQNMRRLNPQLDARLTFWELTSPQTDRAREIEDGLWQAYGIARR